MAEENVAVPTPVLLYRRADLAYCDVARAAQLLLTNVGGSEDRYDIMERTLAECGIVPRPHHSCNVVHAEEFDERVSTFADLVFDRVVTNESVHQAITAVLLEVVAKCTLEASTQHLTKDEQREYVLCSVAETAGSTSLYMDCAKRRAHVGSCTLCEDRVGQCASSMLRAGQDGEPGDSNASV